MPRDRLVLIHDAHQAAGRIIRYLAGRSFADYDADDLLQSAAERQFEIIGEALNVARRDDPLLEESVTNLAGIVGTRNLLAHAYHAVVDAKLWDAVENHLPLLVTELKALLDEDPLEEGSDSL